MCSPRSPTDCSPTTVLLSNRLLCSPTDCCEIVQQTPLPHPQKYIQNGIDFQHHFVVYRVGRTGQDNQEHALVPFGGACFDGDQGSWSTSHVIEIDGSVPAASKAVLSLVNNNNERMPQANDPIMKLIGDTFFFFFLESIRLISLRLCGAPVPSP